MGDVTPSPQPFGWAHDEALSPAYRQAGIKGEGEEVDINVYFSVPESSLTVMKNNVI